MEQSAAKARTETLKAALLLLKAQKVHDLVLHRRRLIEVPYTATLSDTINALLANNVVAVPVAAPPGRWIGAGGSMILESDKATGAVRKQYIGMVTMLDVLVHLADLGETDRGLQEMMSVQVVEVIGHSFEGLSLWTLHPNTSIIDCMETFSKGVHRALVPIESQAEHIVAAEIVESSPGYKMLTQMDALSFLREHGNVLEDIISNSVCNLGAVNENVFAVTKISKVIDVIKSMRLAGLNAVPVVETNEPTGNGDILQDVLVANGVLITCKDLKIHPNDGFMGKGKKLMDTFSATDLRSCSVDQLQSLLSSNVIEFKQKMRCGMGPTSPRLSKNLVKCYRETSLGKVMEAAVEAHVHRVWVVDHDGLLCGLVSLTDMLRAIREAVLRVDPES